MRQVFNYAAFIKSVEIILVDTDEFKKSAFRVLQTLYEMSGGAVGKDVVIAHIAQTVGMDEQTVYNLSRHLEAKGLVGIPVRPNLGVDHSVYITVKGSNEIKSPVGE
jgi:DNA-binding MarR family transcriptional regulator